MNIAPNLCSGEQAAPEIVKARYDGMLILASLETLLFIFYLAAAYSEGVWPW